MTELLTLPEARAAIRLPSSSTSADGELQETYIPAVTTVVEDITGPVVRREEQTFTADGGTTTIMLPSAVTSVDSITDGGTTLDASAYVVDLVNGIVQRGTALAPLDFASGRGAVVVTYTVGTAESESDVPLHVKLAARIILSDLWDADHNGGRTTFGTSDEEMVETPTGRLVPKRAYDLLRSGELDVPGFA